MIGHTDVQVTVWRFLSSRMWYHVKSIAFLGCYAALTGI